MIRPPFRPPLSHNTDKPTTPAADQPAAKTNDSCCGRSNCCGGSKHTSAHESAPNNPGINSASNGKNTARDRNAA